MELLGLRNLHKLMKQEGIQHQKFRIKTGAVSFECLFSAPPFELSLTSQNTQRPEFFLFNILKGYRINTYLNVADFERLIALLKTHGQSYNKLSTKEWFSDIASQIPTTLSKEPDRLEICKMRADLEHRECPYFDTWIPWKVRGPTKQNLQKTLIMLGQEAHDYSFRNRLSSKWSTEDLKRSDWRK